MGCLWKRKKASSNGLTREQVQKGIDISIEIVMVVKDCVAVEPVKGSLAALCALLKLLQVYWENKDELSEIAKWCGEIAMIVKGAAESDHLKTDVHLLGALDELQRFIDGVCQDIEESQRRGTMRRLFGAHGDEKKIEELKEKLNKFLLKFQVHLQVTQSVNVIEILARLKAQPAQSAETGSGSVKYHTPPKPTIFFGREDVVIDIVESIQRGQHVMLVGTGGMGKSSIAKAVLNDSTLVSTFKARLFITYDGIASSAMTYELFLDRIASALKLPSSTYTVVLERLDSLSALLVIDNAETLLEASDVDAGRIAETLGVIADLEAVRVIITTRNHTSVSPNFQCTRLSIGGISMEAACQAFSAVYTVAPVNEDIRLIFTALEYHPLSINILANAAAMNGWSQDEIVQAWNERQAGVLETANDKYRSLRVTAEISIASFKDNSSVVLHILRTIAFLPQGIHRDDIRAMFPSIPDISLQVEAVQRSSLIHKTGERLTMLAPIRMYLSERYNKDLTYNDPVISGIRVYFHGKLSDKAHNFVDQEHGNIDRLLHFDMISAHYNSSLDTKLLVLGKVEVFLICTYQPTSLWPLLESQMQTSKQTPAIITLLCKCLPCICWIDYTCMQYSDSLAKVQFAEVYCREHFLLSEMSLVQCLRLKAANFEMLGNICAAVVAVREGLSIVQHLNSCYDIPDLRTFLAGLLLQQGEITEAKHLLSSSQVSVNSWADALNFKAQVAMLEKRFTDARVLLKTAAALNHEVSLIDIMWQASCEGSAGDFVAALKLLKKATEEKVTIGMRQFPCYADAMEAHAYYEAHLGYVEDARRSIAHALALWSEYGEWSWSGNFVCAHIEWLAGEQQRAISILQAILNREMTVEVHEKNQRNLAATHKALGELMLADSRNVDARAQFEQAKALYDIIGCSPKYLGVKTFHWLHASGIKEEGWDRFLSEQ